MKKLLLLASAAALGTGVMVADEIDITPKNYHFNTAANLPVFSHGVHGANIQGITSVNDITPPIFQNLKAEGVPSAEEQWDNGLIVIGGGQFWNHDNGYYNNVVNGLQIVDLGGEVGKVLAWVGADMDINAVLKAATGYDYNISAKCTGGLNWGNINFFTDPKNTPTEKDGFIRMTFTYQVVAPVTEGAVDASNAMNNIQFKTNENGLKCEGGAWNAPQNYGYDEDMEEDVYDPTTWVEYSIEGICPDSEDGKDYFPMRACMNFPATIAGNMAFFIKDITFTHVTEGAPVVNETVITKKTYNMGEPGSQGLKDVTTDNDFTFSVNGNTVTFSADADIYTVAGVKAAHAVATQGVVLANGIYVARVGEKAVKFVVK